MTREWSACRRSATIQSLPTGQRDQGGGCGADQQGQPDRPVEVVGSRKLAVAEGWPLLDPVAVAVAPTQADPEGAGEGGLHAARVGARVRRPVGL